MIVKYFTLQGLPALVEWLLDVIKLSIWDLTLSTKCGKCWQYLVPCSRFLFFWGQMVLKIGASWTVSCSYQMRYSICQSLDPHFICLSWMYMVLPWWITLTTVPVFILGYSWFSYWFSLAAWLMNLHMQAVARPIQCNPYL